MKKFNFILAVLMFTAPVFGADYFDNFAQYATADNLKPFARDLGGVVGSGLYSTGRGLGFSGFDIGARTIVRFKPAKGNTIMEQSGVDAFFVPMIQGAIGMPFRLDGIVRASSLNGLTIAGGGLRWGILPLSDALYSFNTMLVLAGHAVSHQDFSLTNLSFGAVCSVKLPGVTPYFGASIDRTRLTVTHADDASLDGKRVTVNEPHFTLGANVKLAQFVYISLAANHFNDRTGLETGLGVRF